MHLNKEYRTTDLGQVDQRVNGKTNLHQTDQGFRWLKYEIEHKSYSNILCNNGEYQLSLQCPLYKSMSSRYMIWQKSTLLSNKNSKLARGKNQQPLNTKKTNLANQQRGKDKKFVNYYVLQFIRSYSALSRKFHTSIPHPFSVEHYI